MAVQVPIMAAKRYPLSPAVPFNHSPILTNPPPNHAQKTHLSGQSGHIYEKIHKNTPVCTLAPLTNAPPSPSLLFRRIARIAVIRAQDNSILFEQHLVGAHVCRFYIPLSPFLRQRGSKDGSGPMASPVQRRENATEGH